MANRLQTVLVTGGCGQIGRNVVSRLLADGLQVLVMDLVSDPGLAGAVGVHLFEADVRDDNAVAAAIENVDGVIHLAATDTSVVDMVEHNIVGALNIMDSAHEYQIPTVLLTKANNGVLRDPESIVSHTIERFSHMFVSQYSSVVNVVRLFDSYGPTSAAAESHGLVARMLETAFNGEDITVDAHQMVDAVHVRDVAEVLVDALWYGAEIGNLPRPMDLGTGHPKAALDIAAEVASRVSTLTGSMPKITVKESHNFLEQKVASADTLSILYPNGHNFIEFETGLDETVDSLQWSNA